MSKKTRVTVTTQTTPTISQQDDAGAFVAGVAAAAAASPKARVLQPVCCKTKRDGSPCTARAMTGQVWCTDHRPALLHLREAELEWVRAFLATATPESFVELVGWGQVRVAAKAAPVQA